MKISVIHPSYGRPSKCMTTIGNWMDLSSDIESIEYLISVESSEFSDYLHYLNNHLYRGLFKKEPSLMDSNFGNCISATNYAAKYSIGDVIIFNGDDHEPCEGWDKLIYEAFDFDKPQVLWVDEGIQNSHISIPIMNRKRYEQEGFIWYPEYKSMCADNDFSECAHLDGVVKLAKHIQIYHRHLGSESDATYKHTSNPEFSRIGAEVLEKRRRENFGRNTKYIQTR